jgi:hypothetical protein
MIKKMFEIFYKCQFQAEKIKEFLERNPNCYLKRILDVKKPEPHPDFPRGY